MEKISVLYAEDEEELREITTEMLEDKGLHVVGAGNGEEALEFFSKNPQKIHVVLTDVVMPKISGKVLSKEIRKIDPDMGIVFVSGYARQELSEPLPEKTRFYSKPFNIDEIEQVLIELAKK